jgi:hypothetical protein
MNFGDLSSAIVGAPTLGYLQGNYFLNELLLLVNKKATTVRLPRDDTVHPIFLKLVQHVMQHYWKVMFADVVQVVSKAIFSILHLVSIIMVVMHLLLDGVLRLLFVTSMV